MHTKDFYIGTNFICGVKTEHNIFDLPDNMFNSENFIDFEEAIKEYIKGSAIELYLWPWMWQDSAMTDEVYIYDMDVERLLYHEQTTKDFFDAKLVRDQQSLQGCEVFDFKFQFPRMLSVSPVITAKQSNRRGQQSITFKVPRIISNVKEI